MNIIDKIRAALVPGAITWREGRTSGNIEDLRGRPPWWAIAATDFELNPDGGQYPMNVGVDETSIGAYNRAIRMMEGNRESGISPVLRAIKRVK